MSRNASELILTAAEQKFACECINYLGTGPRPHADENTFGAFTVTYLKKCLKRSFGTANLDGQTLADSVLAKIALPVSASVSSLEDIENEMFMDSLIEDEEYAE